MRDSMMLWIRGARPKTLPAAVAPVVVGVAAAKLSQSSQNNWFNGIFALIVSLALQVAVNFANDYSDGVRGTDKYRVGPLRLVGSGSKSPAAVKRATFVAFGVAAVFGLMLAFITSWWLLVVGVLCFLAGWFYTGGSNPYGYLGLGEVFVFIFFGIVATTGTTFVVIQKLTVVSLLSSVVVGSLACALLAINNLRDIAGDTTAGKRTVAVRLGDRGARKLYIALLVVAGVGICLVSVWHSNALLGLIGFVTAVRPVKRVVSGAIGDELIEVLAMTGRVQMSVALMLSAGLVIG